MALCRRINLPWPGEDKFYKYKQLQQQPLHLLHAEDTLSATSVSLKERR